MLNCRGNELLLPIVEQDNSGATTMLKVSLAGLALMKCDDSVVRTIVQGPMEASDEIMLSEYKL